MALTYIFIHIFTYIVFVTGLCNLLVTSYPVYRVYVFVFRAGQIHPNKEGRVQKFQYESLTEGWLFRL